MISYDCDLNISTNTAAFNVSFRDCPRDVLVGLLDGIVDPPAIQQPAELTPTEFGAHLAFIIANAAEQLKNLKLTP